MQSDRILGLGPQHRGGVLHRAHDLVVAGAAAQVARQPVADFLLAGVGVALQERLGRDHHAGRADTALQAGVLQQLLLHRVQLLELLRMKKKQQFAQRGHKLLKDKLEGLLKDFTGIVQDYTVLRTQVDAELGELFQQFILASASMPAEVYRSALAFPECEAELTMNENLIMNVRVPVFSFAIEGNLLSYGTDGTVVELDQAIVKLKEVLERLVKLAEAEKTIELVADEIEKTRRRVNALEYVLIPQQAETIRFISSKLEELERGNITRLMRIKQLLAM